jgi:hypothetical protein
MRLCATDGHPETFGFYSTTQLTTWESCNVKGIQFEAYAHKKVLGPWKRRIAGPNQVNVQPTTGQTSRYGLGILTCHTAHFTLAFSSGFSGSVTNVLNLDDGTT